MLEGDHLLSHWLKVGRTLTQSNHHSIFRMSSSKTQPIGKTAIPIDTSQDMSWRSTVELTTNMKTAVFSNFMCISQFIRYARCCSHYDDFRYRHKCLVDRLLSQGYIALRLEKSFKKFYGRYQDLIEKYQRSVNVMVNDSFPG